jgi:hypothetical protein
MKAGHKRKPSEQDHELAYLDRPDQTRKRITIAPTTGQLDEEDKIREYSGEPYPGTDGDELSLKADDFATGPSVPREQCDPTDLKVQSTQSFPDLDAGDLPATSERHSRATDPDSEMEWPDILFSRDRTVTLHLVENHEGNKTAGYSEPPNRWMVLDVGRKEVLKVQGRGSEDADWIYNPPSSSSDEGESASSTCESPRPNSRC